MATVIFINLLLLTSYIDYKKRIIPNWCVLLVFIVNLFQSGPIVKRLLSFIIVGLLFLFASVITDGLGGGDVKLLAVSSFYTTFPYSLYISIVALILCTATGYIFKKKSLPFAPFLAIAYIIFIIFKGEIYV